MMVKVSIIVPCYNVEKWVARCLDSLINQSLREIEIICIDDKSTDRTLEILDRYAQYDQRVRLIKHSENTGVASARNSGLDIAKGEYIGFVDPDDYVENHFYEKLYKTAKNVSADVVKGNVVILNSKTGEKNITSWHRIKDLPVLFDSGFWSAIYKKEFLQKFDIKFPDDIRFGEDTVFLSKVCINTQNIAFVADAFYTYTFLREGSLDSEFMSDEKARAVCDMCKIIEETIEHADNFKEYKNLLISTYILANLNYNLSKKLETETYKQKMFDILVYMHKKYGMKREFIKRFGRTRYKFIKKSYYRGFVSYSKHRIYLFGFLPIILEENFDNKKVYKLFDSIPLIKIK